MLLGAKLGAPLGGQSSAGTGVTVYTRDFPALSLAVQQLGQWENSSDITPAVLLQAINYGIVAGYDLLIQKWEDYYTLDTTIAVTTATTIYPVLAAFGGTFYKIRHLDFSTDGVRYQRMYAMDLEATHMYSGVSSGSGRVPRYRIQGGSMNNANDNEALVLAFPVTGTIKAYYIPVPFQFASTADTNVVKFAVPLEERLITHFAHRDLLVRSDLSTADIDRQIALIAGGLRTASDARDAGEAFTLDPRGPRRRLAYWEDWCP